MRGVWSRDASGGAESPDTCVCQKHDPFFVCTKRLYIDYVLQRICSSIFGGAR